MQKRIVGIVLIVAFTTIATAAIAQPMTAAPAMAPAPTMATAPAMAPEVPTMAPEPVAMAPAAPAPMQPAPAAMPAPTAPEKPKVKEPTPEWKKASFWILKVVLPILFFVLGLLVTLGVIKKSWLQWLRKKKIIEIADKVVTQFETYAKASSATWDDILAQVLKAVVVRIGELAPEEENTVRKIVEERKGQAEKKTPSEDSPNP